MDTEALWLSAAFLIIAFVYAAAGQAGATGYIAAMALFGVAPVAMKTTALSLNLAVASIGTALIIGSGRLAWRNVYPFAILGVPFSLLGGAVELPTQVYYPIVGVILIVAALQMVRSALGAAATTAVAPASPPFWAALSTGAIIGFVSGTTGTGGGVFLAPVILLMNWGSAHQTAATTAVYNLMNSAAALLGASAAWAQMPSALPWWLLAVAAGGSAGALLGGRYLSDRWLRSVLAVLLFGAGQKLLWW